ncbi:protein of unknown function [Streptomyces murinus]
MPDSLKGVGPEPVRGESVAFGDRPENGGSRAGPVGALSTRVGRAPTALSPSARETPAGRGNRAAPHWSK